GWARLSGAGADASGLVAATPIALFPRERGTLWVHAAADHGEPPHEASLDDAPRAVLETLRRRGASFAHEVAAACQLNPDALRGALSRLVSVGLVTSDGFGGLRGLLRSNGGGRTQVVGRWSAANWPPADTDGEVSSSASDAAVESQARALLRRYGII